MAAPDATSADFGHRPAAGRRRVGAVVACANPIPLPDFKELQLHALEAAYAVQEEQLDERHDETGQDIYVAPFWCLKRPDGTPASATGWPRGIESMLPKADVIMFMRDGANAGIVTWQGAESVVGNLIEPLDMYPPRYRVRAFPTEEQLAWMASEHAA